MSSNYHYKVKIAWTSSWNIPIKLNNICQQNIYCVAVFKLRQTDKSVKTEEWNIPPSHISTALHILLSPFTLPPLPPLLTAGIVMTPRCCAISLPATRVLGALLTLPTVLSGDGCSLPVFFMTHMFISLLPTLSRLIITSFAVCWYAPGKKCLNFWMNNF